MKQRTRKAISVGILFLSVGVSVQAAGISSFVVGPIEQTTDRSVTVLGQRYLLKNAETNRLSAGTLVLVEGQLNRDGVALATRIRASKQIYVPGALDVALTGVVTSFDRTSGLLTIGTLSVYAVDAVGADQSTIAIGSIVEILGRQAAPNGVLWASEIRHSAQAIEGTGRSTQAIEGTGRSTQAIEGTGSSTQAIEGTGLSTQAIEGTGRSTQAIQGTGLSTQAIEGTGRSTQAIEGTGRSTQAIEGTGRSTQAIEGTRRSTQAIEGTGRSTQAIEGTGRSTQAIEGTGRSTQAIEGTGRSTQAIEGTGKAF
ncbi:MAG TPA: DUF5666 domain-containing protein [Steroidobacteraceae bacterium]|nr:DUF5666 domain-containing protein [Steroidobacteraceae bacterium]